MNQILLLHHYLYIFILFLLSFVILFFLYKKNNINFICKKINSLLVYSIHIQACFGLILFIKNVYFIIKNNFSLLYIINTKNLRSRLIEHPIIMLLVVIIITLLNIKLKRKNKIDYKTIFIYFFILIILLTRIPIRTSFFLN